ncbi:hypothetical protein Fmac_011779 [Flemingia macrophylla]|uniref:FCP1 homology domain-containing protein n=1 Tax=Flemingia macrophylla TaxID=520843 RepID=A0ABD1MNE3_9FABA
MHENYLSTFQVPNVSYDANQSVCANVTKDSEGHRYINLSDLVLPGTMQTNPIMVEETTRVATYHDDGVFHHLQQIDTMETNPIIEETTEAANYHDDGVFQLQQIDTMETKPILVEETTGAANYHDDGVFQLQQINTMETNPIMVEETTGAANYHDNGVFQLQQINTMETNPIMVEKTTGAASYHDNGVFQLQQINTMETNPIMVEETTRAANYFDDGVFRLQQIKTMETNPIMVEETTRAANYFDDGVFQLQQINIMETNPIMVEKATGAANYYHDDGGFQLQQICDFSWFDHICHQVNPLPENIHNNYIQFDSDRTDSIDQETLFLQNCLLELSETSDGILPALVSKETVKKKNITLVLDLDETLVHSCMKPCNDVDFTYEIYKKKTKKNITVYVRKRPFLQEFLEKVSDMFEIIIFTAGTKVYAEKLLDVLDPHNKFFYRRLYRESCTLKDHRLCKDLTVLGVDLAKVFIIDNTPEVVRFQVNNGIPIKSWFGDRTDSALISLLPFLEKLVDVDDVRPIIALEYGASN